MYNMFAVSVYSVSDCQSFKLSQGDSWSHAQRYIDCNYTCQTIMPCYYVIGCNLRSVIVLQITSNHIVHKKFHLDKTTNKK